MREGYRAALRTAREGNEVDARAKLDQVLQTAPGTGEALQLREWLEQHPRAAQAPQFDFQTVFRSVEKGWQAHLPAETRPQPHTRLPDTGAKPLWRRPMAWLGLAVLTLFGMTFVPLPRNIPATARLTPPERLEVTADREGVVGGVSVEEGARVKPGTEIFTWDVSEERAQLADLEATLAQEETLASPMDLDVLRAEVGRLETLIAQRRVLAPSAGVVRALRALPMTRYNPGEPMYRIDTVDPLMLSAALTPRQIHGIEVGDAVTVRFGDLRVPARVESVDNSTVTATLPNAEGKLGEASRAVTLEFGAKSFWDRLR